MTAIQRTAYPRFRRLMSARELATHFTPTAEERTFIHEATRSRQHRLNLAVLLKAFQYLGYFPRLNAVPVAVVQHLILALDLDTGMRLRYESQRTLRDHQQQIRSYLNVLSAGHHRRHVIAVAVHEAVQVMDTPADLINVAIEALRKANCELPAFSTLDRMVGHGRFIVNMGLFHRLLARLSPEDQQRLDALLSTDPATKRSPFVRLKLKPKRPTRTSPGQDIGIVCLTFE